MKNKTSLKWLITIFVITITAFGQKSFAQGVTKRLPDGTVVYSDGTVRLPNGEIRYPKNNGTRLPDGTVIYPKERTYPGTTAGRYPRRGTRQSDGSIIFPDGRIKYPDGTIRYPDGTIKYPNKRHNNGTWIPPGQRKKMYGKKYKHRGHDDDHGYDNRRSRNNREHDGEDD